MTRFVLWTVAELPSLADHLLQIVYQPFHNGAMGRVAGAKVGAEGAIKGLKLVNHWPGVLTA